MGGLGGLEASPEQPSSAPSSGFASQSGSFSAPSPSAHNDVFAPPTSESFSRTNSFGDGGIGEPGPGFGGVWPAELFAQSLVRGSVDTLSNVSSELSLLNDQMDELILGPESQEDVMAIASMLEHSVSADSMTLKPPSNIPAEHFRRRTHSDSHLRRRTASPPASPARMSRHSSNGSLDRLSPTPSPRLSRRRGSLPRLLPYPQSPHSPSSPLAASAVTSPPTAPASSGHSPLASRRAMAQTVSCEHCNRPFSNLDALAEHTCQAAPQYAMEMMLACDECNKRYSGNKIVERRLRWFRVMPETSWRGKKCEICGDDLRDEVAPSDGYVATGPHLLAMIHFREQYTQC